METLTAEQFKKRYGSTESVGETISGAEFAKRYPQTAQQPETDMLDKLSGIFSTVFGGKAIGEYIGAKIAKSQYPEQAKFITEPTKLQIAGDVAGIGLTVASLGGAGLAGGLGARVAKGAALGSGLTVAKGIAEAQKPSDIATGAVVGAGLGGAIPIAGSLLSSVGRQVQQLPARFVNSAVSRSKQQVLQDIARDKVDDFANYVLKSKPVGTASKLLNDSIDSVQTLNTKVNVALQNAVRQTGGKVSLGTANLLDDMVKSPEAQGALLDRNGIRGIITGLAPQTKQLLNKPSLTLIEANRLRQLLDQTLGDKGFLTTQLSANKTILKNFANSLRETIKAKAPSGTRELFTELSNEIRFRDGLLQKIAQKQGNQVLSFGDFIGGGLGGIFGGGLPGAVLGVGARRAIESVPFKLSAAKTINAITKVAPVLKSLTPAQQTAILSMFATIFSREDLQEEIKPRL